MWRGIRASGSSATAATALTPASSGLSGSAMDYVMPKSGDDMIAPDFIESLMNVLQAHPNAAMCHAAGLVFRGTDTVVGRYPAEHCLDAAEDPLARARHVMGRYTSSPAFWGVYRRAAVDRLAPIRYRAGWDHVLLAELALTGEIRHVARPLYWRRDGGKPVLQLARAASRREPACRWMIRPGGATLAHARDHLRVSRHLEMAAATRLPHADRLPGLMIDARAIFLRARWLAALIRKAETCRALASNDVGPAARLAAQRRCGWPRSLAEALRGASTIVPEVTDHRSGSRARLTVRRHDPAGPRQRRQRWTPCTDLPVRLHIGCSASTRCLAGSISTSVAALARRPLIA